MNTEEMKRLKKELREMDVIDNFLFTEIMSDEENGKEACRLILSRVLGREIGEIDFTPERVVPGLSEKTHGIRLDAYITEKVSESGEKSTGIKVYDVEPDKRSSRKEELARRSRYYADLIDVQLLNVGTDYEKLPELVTIFILSYDPFGANAMIYEAGSTIKTHPDIPYNDGIRRIFLYVDGNIPDNAEEHEIRLKALLAYIGRSIEENVTDEATKRLDDIVRGIKSKPEVGIRYMKSWEHERDLQEQIKRAQDKAEEEKQRADTEQRRADTEQRRADAEQQRADAEQRRADAEQQRADEAEMERDKALARIAELESILRK